MSEQDLLKKIFDLQSQLSQERKEYNELILKSENFEYYQWTVNKYNPEFRKDDRESMKKFKYWLNEHNYSYRKVYHNMQGEYYKFFVEWNK